MADPQSGHLLPLPEPGDAEPVAGMADGIFSSIAHDVHTGWALVVRQLSLPMRPDGFWAMLALIAAGLVIAWPLRRVAILLVARLVRPHAQGGSMLALIEAVTTVILTTLAFLLGGALVLAGCETGLYLLPITRALGQTAVAGVAVTGFATGIGRAVIAIEDPEHRPFPSLVTPDWVYRLYPPALGLMLGLSGLVEQGAHLLHAATPTRALAHGVVLTVEAALIAGFLVAIGRSRDAAIGGGGYKPVKAAQAMTGVAWAVLFVGIVGFLVGRVSFAVLLLQELIWSLLVMAFAVMLTSAITLAIDWGTGQERGLRRFAVHVVGIRAERVTQVGLLLSAVLTVVVWLMAVSLMIAPLGGSGVVLVDQLRGGALIGELGKMPVAPLAILAGVGVLIVGIALTRLVRRWLERRFLPATNLDIGARAAIVTGIGYACILLVLLAAVSATGIDLSKVTLIASALSVGIGFGLQSIIQNFVSGIILLGERPIKVGDWVVAAGAEGSVRRIKVRATELATADGSIAIVPNSSFISGAVTNRSGEGIAGRVEVSIRIGGLPTAAQARDTVMALVDRIEGVLKMPAPQLLLTDINADGFGFTLQIYADRRKPVAVVRSQLLYALVDGLSNELKVLIT